MSPGPQPEEKDSEPAAALAAMSALSDSGYEEELQSPSPSRQDSPRGTEDPEQRPAAGWQHRDETFNIQRNCEEDFQSSRCLAHQPQITAEARCKLISWLVALYKHFKLSFESCCLAVNIVDRFLVTTPVAADCFQLLGVTALLIATKQVEICSPRIQHLLALCCDAFSKEQLCNLECLVLLRLNFRLAAPTLAFFLDYSVTRELSGPNRKAMGEQNAWRYKRLARKVCELSLADYAFNKYRPSVIVQSAVRLAKDLLRRHLKESAVRDVGLTEMLDFLCVADDESLGSEELPSVQQCADELRLLVSLNQESIQKVIELCTSTEH